MADDKKIIIDEDWKAQVQAEKEAAAVSRPAESQPSSAGDSQAGQHVPLPPASLEMLLTMLATEAMVALGHLPHPATGQPHADRAQAQYLIDMIDMLREKTQGNLTEREQDMIETLLHQLKLAFVETAGMPPSGAAADHTG